MEVYLRKTTRRRALIREEKFMGQLNEHLMFRKLKWSLKYRYLKSFRIFAKVFTVSDIYIYNLYAETVGPCCGELHANCRHLMEAINNYKLYSWYVYTCSHRFPYIDIYAFLRRQKSVNGTAHNIRKGAIRWQRNSFKFVVNIWR